MHEREYGALAQLGLAVPQANPIVEPELRAYLPDGVNVIAARLQGSRTDSKDRLVGYLRTLEETLNDFDTADLDAVGYACTGSSYIVGKDEDQQTMARMEDKFGYPVISAAAAIKDAIDSLGASKIAVFAPYPQWLADLSIDYWKGEGFDVVAHAAAPLDPNDTRSVYKIRSASVLDNVKKLELEQADVLVLTGTGMPTLKAIGLIAGELEKPVLTSNLCLAWALQKVTGIGPQMPPPTRTEPLFSGWRDRLRA
jgi:maleate isomerase